MEVVTRRKQGLSDLTGDGDSPNAGSSKAYSVVIMTHVHSPPELTGDGDSYYAGPSKANLVVEMSRVRSLPDGDSY